MCNVHYYAMLQKKSINAEFITSATQQKQTKKNKTKKQKKTLQHPA